VGEPEAGAGGPSASFDATAADAGGPATTDGPSDREVSEAGDPDAAGGALDVALDASSWPAPTGALRLKNAFNGKYLNASIPPADASTFTPGVPVVTYSYTGATNQCWTFLYRSGDDSYELITNTGRCLDDPYGDAASGTTMQQYQCWQGNNNNQRWYLVNNHGLLSIAGQASGKCLTSTSDQDPAPLYISDCSTSPSEQWEEVSNCP
jgi:hypothetical protein